MPCHIKFHTAGTAMTATYMPYPISRRGSSVPSPSGFASGRLRWGRSLNRTDPRLLRVSKASSRHLAKASNDYPSRRIVAPCLILSLSRHQVDPSYLVRLARYRLHGTVDISAGKIAQSHSQALAICVDCNMAAVTYIIISTQPRALKKIQISLWSPCSLSI